MDVRDRLNQLTATVRGAKAMPMSTSCLVNRAEMLDTLARLRDELPKSFDHANALLSDREAVLAATREQAERILEDARSEREELIEQTDLLVAARARAATLAAESRAQSTRLQADADDYVDRKLAEFDALLGQLASQVNNGRLRLAVRREADLASGQGPMLGAPGNVSEVGPHSTSQGAPQGATRQDKGGSEVLAEAGKVAS